MIMLTAKRSAPSTLTGSALVSLALLTSACDDYDFPHCEETATEIDADSITPSGHSVADVLAAIEGERQVELRYPPPRSEARANHNFADAEPTTLTLDLTPDVASKIEAASVRWIESEEVYPTSGFVPAIGLVCHDRLEVDATLGFSTLDGAFAELFDVTIRAELDWDGELSDAVVVVDYDPEQLDGDLRVDSVEPSEGVTRVDHFISVSYPLTDEAAERDGVVIGEPSGRVAGGAEHEGNGGIGYFAFVVAHFGADTDDN